MARSIRTKDAKLEHFLLREVNGLRREAPSAVALHLGEHRGRQGKTNYDIVYSSDLSRLTDSAARRFIKSAIKKVKPGGCLLLANALTESRNNSAKAKRSPSGCYLRTALALAQLTRDIPEEILAGQALVLDESAKSVCLELHTRRHYSSRY